jgi:hypothetical protein
LNTKCLTSRACAISLTCPTLLLCTVLIHAPLVPPLFHCQGRPSSLWKITILTIVSLQFIVWSISGTLIPILGGRGINIGLILFITTFTTVLVNIYIGLPLMTLFFGSWLRIPRPPVAEMSTMGAILDAGLSHYQRLLFMLFYFGIVLGYGFWKYFK